MFFSIYWQIKSEPIFCKFSFKLEFSSLFEADHRENVQLGYAWGLLKLYLLCDNGDVWYFCCVREDTALAFFEFYKYKNVPV